MGEAAEDEDLIWLPEPSKWQKRVDKLFTFLLVVVALVFFVVAIWAITQVGLAEAAGPCSGRAYEGRPGLVHECRHQQEVIAGQNDQAYPYPEPWEPPQITPVVWPYP